MSEIEVLRRALEIISDPTKWTQGTFARDKFGNSIEPDDPHACRWCALGAISHVAKENGVADGIEAEAVDRLLNITPDGRSVFAVNDNDGHAAVLALFDKALASRVTP